MLTSPHTRAGVVYAVLAAASAGLLLFLPVLLLAYSFGVVAAVARGEGLAWQSSVAMTYTFIGIPAVLGLLLLFIPYALFRAADRRLGTRQAVRWVGSVLAVLSAGVALIWAWEAFSGPKPVLEGDEIWYAVAFGVAAVVTLIATVVAEKRAASAAVALAGVLAVALVGLVAVLVAAWGTPLRIPRDAQEVHIVVTDSAVPLEPATVRAGDVYFIVDEPDDPTGHAGFTFVSRGYGGHCCEDPLPMSDDDVARLAQGDYQGTAMEGGWGNEAKFTLREGNYVFVIAGPGGELPGVPPMSMAVLEVVP
jgi:hypothetical protein